MVLTNILYNAHLKKTALIKFICIDIIGNIGCESLSIRLVFQFITTGGKIIFQFSKK